MWFFGKSKEKAVVDRPNVPSVSFDPSRVTLAVEAEIKAVLKNAGEDASSNAVYDAALRCARAGGDMATLYHALTAVGMPRSEASDLALYVNNRARVVMDRDRAVSLGITEAVWVHSGAPCSPTRGEASAADKKQDQEHRSLNGKRFRLAEGVQLNDSRTWPGYEPSCKCITKPLIAGFD